MIKLTNAHTIAYVNEKSCIIGEIFVDEVSELPEPDGVEGYELVQGSATYVIKSGELYVMGGDGKWHNSNGGAVPEADDNNEEVLK